MVAAGEILGESALNAAVIVKFSQNALLGLVAFAISLWWAFRNDSRNGERPTVSVIWERFPKFVLGFVVASLLFSFVLSSEFVDSTRDLMRGLRSWWFALAFVIHRPRDPFPQPGIDGAGPSRHRLPVGPGRQHRLDASDLLAALRGRHLRCPRPLTRAPAARRLLGNPPLARRSMTKCHVSGRRGSRFNRFPAFS